MGEAMRVADALLALADAAEATDTAFTDVIAATKGGPLTAAMADAAILTHGDEELACEVAVDALAPNDIDAVAAALAFLPPRKAGLAFIGLSRGIMRYRWENQDRREALS
jgi:hypothetical protein